MEYVHGRGENRWLGDTGIAFLIVEGGMYGLFLNKNCVFTSPDVLILLFLHNLITNMRSQSPNLQRDQTDSLAIPHCRLHARLLLFPSQAARTHLTTQDTTQGVCLMPQELMIKCLFIHVLDIKIVQSNIALA